MDDQIRRAFREAEIESLLRDSSGDTCVVARGTVDLAGISHTREDTGDGFFAYLISGIVEPGAGESGSRQVSAEPGDLVELDTPSWRGCHADLLGFQQNFALLRWRNKLYRARVEGVSMRVVESRDQRGIDASLSSLIQQVEQGVEFSVLRAHAD